MTGDDMPSESTPAPAGNQPPAPANTAATPGAAPVRRRLALKIALALVGLALLYVAVAYVLLPLLWKRYAHRHPGLEDIPGVTYTAAGIPADPLNVALVGTKAEVMKIMVAAKWYPADPLTLASCLEIAEASVLRRPFDDAPVSSEYLFGRREDLAFEKPVGNSPRERHHVRFWRCPKEDADGRPVWVGSAIFDKRVGLSHTTGQITHITAPDIDAERAFLFADLERTGGLAETYFIDDFHKVRKGRNGEGEPWHTDGRLEVGVIKTGADAK
jgi:LssY C-terminus